MAESNDFGYASVTSSLRKAFASGKTRDYDFRIQQLQQLNKLMEENEDALYEALYKDLRKNRTEAKLMEVMQVKIELGNAIQNLEQWMKPERVNPDLINKSNTCEIISDPLGLVLIIGAWNYPIQLTLLPIVGAIAAGNCVILKPSELSVATSTLTEELIPKYLDQDCYRVINGGIPETTALLKERFDHILYTGNPAVGKIVMRAAAEHLTPVTLELGGKCPTLIDYGCSMEPCAQRLVWGKYANAGQTCLAPDYALCLRGTEDDFIQAVQNALEKFYTEDPQTSNSYGRIINERHFKRLSSMIDQSKVVYGGKTDEKDLYIAPTIMKDVTESDAIMKDEIFGPILPVMIVDSVDEAISFIQSREKPLAAYIFSNNQENIKKFSEQTSSGGFVANDALVHGAVPALPFGGVGHSGMGSYHGKKSFDTFSHKKSAVMKNQGMESMNIVRYPPYDDDWKVLKWAEWFLTPTMAPKRRMSLF